MLHLIYGNDTITVRQKAHDFITVEEQKGVRVEKIEVDNYTEGIFEDVVGAVSLFGEKTLYVLDTLSTKEQIFDDVLKHLEQFAESDSDFLVIEEKILAPVKKKFQKYTKNIEEYKTTVAERFNPFGMADALSRKDKKTLWLQLQDAKHAGLSAEEIIGTLWWQLKSMRLAKLTSTAGEAGMKDFPYSKAKRALGAFQEGELERLSYGLLMVYHEGHTGIVDIDIALERWVLTL